MAPPLPAISVVVPTRDRPAALRRCLAALARQEGMSMEVVVVDDGSRDRSAVADAVQGLPGARLVRGTGRGPAAARNLGAAHSRGKILLFTDDDCEPEVTWARRLAAAAGGGAAAGPTVNVALGAAASAAQAITDHLRVSSSAPDGARVGFAPTSNLGATRELISRLPFDDSYPLAAGEDRAWCARLQLTGAGIRWASDAVVHHRHEMRPGEFLSQQLRYGRGAARFHRSGPTPPAHRRRLSLYLGFARAGFASGVAAGVLVCAGQVATAVGFALERFRPAERS